MGSRVLRLNSSIYIAKYRSSHQVSQSEKKSKSFPPPSHLQTLTSYTGLFGKNLGGVINHVQGAVDRRDIPMPMRLVQTMLLPIKQNAPLIPQAKSATFNPRNVVFRSLFCTDMVRDKDRWIWSAEQLMSKRENEEVEMKPPKRQHPVLTGVVEFEKEDDANAFFHATTYTAASNTWGGRLWSVPDHNGVKFWLHVSTHHLTEDRYLL